MKLTNRRKLFLILLTLGLAMISCLSEVLVKNTTPVPVRVWMNMPDSTSFEIRKLEPNDSHMFTGANEGEYSVAAIADEEYIRECNQKRDDLTFLLTTNADMMSDQELQTLLENIVNLKGMIQKMKTVSCRGKVTEEYAPVVTISVDPFTKEWSISCE